MYQLHQSSLIITTGKYSIINKNDITTSQVLWKLPTGVITTVTPVPLLSKCVDVDNVLGTQNVTAPSPLTVPTQANSMMVYVVSGELYYNVNSAVANATQNKASQGQTIHIQSKDLINQFRYLKKTATCLVYVTI
jgi:hypothetical protein